MQQYIQFVPCLFKHITGINVRRNNEKEAVRMDPEELLELNHGLPVCSGNL